MPLAEREEAVVAPGQDERRAADEGQQRPAVVVASRNSGQNRTSLQREYDMTQ
jgi:hypothetical protein